MMTFTAFVSGTFFLAYGAIVEALRQIEQHLCRALTRAGKA